jgi:methionine-S-sulfoxide reductase
VKKIFVVGFSLFIAGLTTMVQAEQAKNLTKATFAGGCFWCMQPPYEKLKGVSSVTVGYTGGSKANPTYEEVCSGRTGHAEAVQIVFDSAQLSYDELLDVFWKNIDPTTKNSQFADHGDQYRTAIFYHTPEQKKSAEVSKEKWQKSGKFEGPIVTEIVPAATFYPAEDYHQDYYKKCPLPYKSYRRGSGREGYLEKKWGSGS